MHDLLASIRNASAAEQSASLAHVRAWITHDYPALKLSEPNRKTRKLIEAARERGLAIKLSQFRSFSILAGHSCPGARDCLARVEKDEQGKRKLHNGAAAIFQCFSASQELQYEGTYNQRAHNLDAVRGIASGARAHALAACKLGGVAPEDWTHRTRLTQAYALAAAIVDAMPRDRRGALTTRLVRVHVSGDFYSLVYLLAWLIVALEMPDCTFYAYTKSLHHLAALDCDASQLPSNVRIVCSVGGAFDNQRSQLESRGFSSAHVIVAESTASAETIASARGLAIDQDDSLAAFGDRSFALLVHGPQAKGSEAARAVASLQREKRAAK
jgi:hypothetical protein